ncbi:SAICAR synthase-like protein [Pleurostoma richardsiae]|uniref:1-phosphatidylinositol-4-phosphate 5-kinase n=1 Tax=Pleurostoma richardsiae TaxID=41990 RepID=A0AA38RG63_9PEZI|nr:SAICAR synthase-like protein [Pleurostoma richardsiae]
MPSFLNDENSPICLQSTGIVHLDPASEYGLSDKVNGLVLTEPNNIHKSDKSDDSFDESSARSTHTSDSREESRPPLNGDDSTAPSSMSTLTNGVLSGGVNGSSPKKPLPNGDAATTTATLADRTLPPQQHLYQDLPNGDSARGRGSVESSLKDGNLPRTSTNSVTGGSIQQSPVEVYSRQETNRGYTSAELVVGGMSPTASPNSLAVPALSVPDPNVLTPTPSTPNPESSQQRAHHSPHRFSSPPLYYHSAGATPSSSNPGALHSAAPAGLKHRHTLEVPKVAPPRGSRDGLDTAFSSGRFSPTTTSTPGGRRASLSLGRRNTRSIHSDMPRDEILPDEDALRWAEAYRQKRASKRRRREEEDDDRVLVGTKVDEKHANWVTAYNMLTGIRVSVSRTNAKLDRELTDADFEAKQKSTFDIAGNELVPSAKYDFKFKDYAPWVFRHLRALFRLDPADYLMSLTGKYILSELGSPGKSGSFFYFSRDYKYIIKTIHHAEHKFLRKILKDYYKHVTDNPNTLLSQFYGLHRVKTPYGRKIHFVVMNNLFPPHRDIHMTFDLKGSTIGRDFKEDDLAKNPRATLKDLNWLRRKRHLELGLEKKRLFLEQLNKDVRLLQKLQIMDYSLLIGIHDLAKGNEENLRAKTLKVFNPGGEQAAADDFDPHSVLMRTPSKLENARKARELRQMIKSERPMPMDKSMRGMPDELEEGNKSDLVFYRDDGGFQATHEDNTPGDEIYYLGVIDCLTHYGIIKKIEHFWKGLSHERSQISALPPDQYGERFINFISGITMSEEEARREAAEKDRAAAEAAAAAEALEKEGHRKGSLSSARRRSSTSHAPPAPTHQPPAPPGPLRSPEVEATLRKAEKVARKHPEREDDVPERVLCTTATATGVMLPVTTAHGAPVAPGGTLVPAVNGTKHSSSTLSPAPEWERRESTNQPVLPVLDEEAAEVSSTRSGGGSRISHASRFSSRTEGTEYRPLTPAKDGEEFHAGFSNPNFSPHNHSSNNNTPRRAPPTPPKTASGHAASGLLKPDSADSGVGVGGNGGGAGAGRMRSGSQASGVSLDKDGRVKGQVSRESLDKALPPLPRVDGAAAS